MPPGSTVLVFAHGQLMQAVRIAVLHPEAGNAEKMRSFGGDNQGIHNCETTEFNFQDGCWQMTEPFSSDHYRRK